MDELLIRRITNLKASLQDIRNNLLNLQDIHKEIGFELKSFLLIDDQILNFDDYSKMISIFNEIENEISSVFIPMVDSNL